MQNIVGTYPHRSPPKAGFQGPTRLTLNQMKIFRRFVQECKNFLYGLSAILKSRKAVVNFDVPLVSQFSIPEQAEPTLKKLLLPVNDPNWEKSGASSPDRYARWALTMCGMASTSMALEFFQKRTILPAVLAENALKDGVYIEKSDDISDMSYRPYRNWIRKYGLKADVYSKLSLRGIQHALSSDKLIIVSVNPNIRGYNTAPLTQKGGHLVVVTGYNLTNQTITINNPSGFTSTNTHKAHKITFETFLKYYAGRGIILRKIM